MKKKKIIFIRAIPPPYHGVTIFNEKILNSKLCDVFDISHLDTSDHRSLDNLGKFDLKIIDIKSIIEISSIIR